MTTDPPLAPVPSQTDLTSACLKTTAGLSFEKVLYGLAAACLPDWNGTTYAPNNSGASNPLTSTPVSGCPAFTPILVPDNSVMSFHADTIRKDFPILSEKINGKSLIWFDNAATTQKPRCVIDRLGFFYEHENSNIHRAAHSLAARATEAYEEARSRIGRFIGAGDPREIVFLRSATEAVNLVAQTYGRATISEGDEVVLSALEHHANIVPWQMLCAEKKANLRVIPLNDRGEPDLDVYKSLL